MALGLAAFPPNASGRLDDRGASLPPHAPLFGLIEPTAVSRSIEIRRPFFEFYLTAPNNPRAQVLRRRSRTHFRRFTTSIHGSPGFRSPLFLYLL